MSAESLAIALNHSRAKGTAKVVMLGIANHDGDGGAWPSIATLARYANVDERTVQRAVDQLERLGEVQRIRQGGGTHLMADGHRPNLYRVMLTCPHDCDRTTQHRTAKQAGRPRPIAELSDYGVPLEGGVTPVSPGGASVTPRVTPTSPGGVTPVSPKPSLELTTHLPGDNSSDRARENSCPALRHRHPSSRAHSFEASGYCRHCGTRSETFEHPADGSPVDPQTGEIA